MRRHRFACPSKGLSLSPLGGRGSALSVGLAMALVVHAVAVTVRLADVHAGKRTRPLTTRFVKRAPRLTKPLELEKRPRPKQREMRRQMVSQTASARRSDQTRFAASSAVLRSLARPKAHVARVVSWPGARIPLVVAEQIGGAKQSESQTSLALEMLDISALDTGKYHAMVVQDPDDKRNVRGFLHLAYAYSVRIRDRNRSNEESRMLLGLHRLVAAINQYTGIKADFAGRITLDSNELFKVPWAFVGSHTTFDLTQNEAANLGRYLRSGGFVLAEDWWPGLNKLWTPGYTGLYQMLIDALASVGLVFGRDWVYELIPNDHPICHCYFDFDAPPLCHGFYGTEVNYPVNGVTVNERVYAILSRRSYSGSWANDGPGGAYGGGDPTRNFQFGVNMIVFALTQEGSITRRVMDSVR